MSRWRADLEEAVVSRHDLAHDRKPEPGSLAKRSRYPVEAFEHLVALHLRNARSRVFDAQERDVSGTAGPYGDGSSRRGVAKRVVDQVVDKLWQQQGIA